LESQIGLEVLSDLSDETLERQLSDEKFGRFLVFSDFSESNGSRSVSVRFLHSTGGWGALASSLGRQLLSWSLSSSGFASGLLGTSHSSDRFDVERELNYFQICAPFISIVQFD